MRSIRQKSVGAMLKTKSSTESELERMIELAKLGQPVWNQIVNLVYERLVTKFRVVAGDSASSKSLGATVLIHEAYLKFAKFVQNSQVNDCQHFFALFNQAIRHALADHYRCKKRLKNGASFQRIEFDLIIHSLAEQTCEFNELQEYLDILNERAPRASQALDMQVFLQLTIREIASALDIGESTAEKELRLAKASLRQLIEKDDSRFS